MKFIHAVIFDRDEWDNMIIESSGRGYWDDLTDGDYIVHCLYSIDNDKVIVLEDNIHESVEVLIEAFIDGIKFSGQEVEVTKACVVVDNGLSYCTDIVKLCLVEGNYVEVKD